LRREQEFRVRPLMFNPLMLGLMLCGLCGGLSGCGEGGVPERSTGAPEIQVAAPSDDATGQTAPPTAPAVADSNAAPDTQLSSTDTAEPQPTAPPPDTDGDGVTDTVDSCPDTEQGKQVDANGCPVDPDGDGVVGPVDLCPDSPYGEPVDATGCRPRLAVAQEYTLLLTFETGSAKIIGDPRGALAEVAALITQYPETTVVIEGHTDDKGPAAFNMKMSKARAEAVANVLITDLGIDAARVSAKAFGETKPIATNATKEGRERNRRVVAVVLPGKAPAPIATTADQ
jgi:OmpA-OmpF porin, OOP family